MNNSGCKTLSLSSVRTCALVDVFQAFFTEGRFAFGFNHSPVADQADLRSQSRGIGGVALEDAHRQGLSIGGCEQTHDDLFFAPLAIPVVALLGQLIVRAFQIAGGHIVKHQGRWLAAALDIRFVQTVLNLGLLLG